MNMILSHSFRLVTCSVEPYIIVESFYIVSVCMNFDPQSNKVVVLLEVQLTGEDQWFRVKISCPLIQRNSNKNRLIPSRKWGLLMRVNNLSEREMSSVSLNWHQF